MNSLRSKGKKKKNKENEHRVGKLEQIVKKQMRNIKDKENEIKMERSQTNRGEWRGESWRINEKKKSDLSEAVPN